MTDRADISGTFDRRETLALGAVAALAVATPWLATPMGAAPGDYLAFLDALSDTVIPGSAKGAPGAFLVDAMPSGLFGLGVPQLRILETALARRGNGDFLALSADRRGAVLNALDGDAFAGRLDADTIAAWQTIKTALLSVYYTSEQGASIDLVYELVPGHWSPDLPLADQPRPLSNDTLARMFT